MLRTFLPSAVHHFDFQAAFGVLHELAFHVAAQIEVAAMGDAFQLAIFAGRQERKRVLDVGRADRVVAELVLARARAAAAARRPGRGSVYQAIRRSRQYSYHLRDVVGWQKNSISICSNSRERNVKFRGVISLRKLLPTCAMPNGMLNARAVEHVFEIDEDALGRFGAQERGVFFAAHRADDRLEHQVEFARLGERARLSWPRARAPCSSRRPWPAT